MNISIHALREEGDEDALDFLFEVLGFLSTPSARRATREARSERTLKDISIHALREEGDNRSGRNNGGQRVFLSTPSARRATTGTADKPAPYEDFYPRPPRGGRQQKQRQNLYFLINYTTFCTNLEEP